MEMSYIVNSVQGKTGEVIGRTLPLSVKVDSNDEAVLRVVDAAPFAYDSSMDKLKTNDITLQEKIDTLINAIANNSLTGLVDSELPIVAKAKTMANLKYIYPLQEENSRIAYDLSTNAYNAQKVNISTLNTNGFNAPRRTSIFRSVGDSYIRVPKVCSVRNSPSFTWFGVVDVVNSGVAKKIYSESTGDMAEAARFQVVLNADLTISVYVRSGISSQAPLTFISTNPLTVGYHMIFVSVIVASNNISVYVDNGVTIPKTVTNSLTPDTMIADTAPISPIYIGTGALNATTPTTPTYVGNMAYVGLFSGRNLSNAEMQDLAIAGGFLSYDRV